MSDIPIIDISRTEQDADGVRATAFQIDRACRDTGFFTLTGHGIQKRIIEGAHAALKEFFSLPREEKEKCRLPTGFTSSNDNYTPYGYSGLLEENAFAYMGVPDKPSDYVEKFSVGRRIQDDGDVTLPFPPGDFGAALRQRLKGYFGACEALSARLAALLTIPLGMPKDFFAERIDKSDDSMRAHYYPGFTQEFETDQGMGEHTDGSLFTLLTHTASGIQVRARDGEWVTLRFQSLDHIVVNIGDLLAHWTKNEYVSTPHRVVLSNWPRQSIVFFKLTNEDELVQAGNRQMDALFGRSNAG